MRAEKGTLVLIGNVCHEHWIGNGVRALEFHIPAPFATFSM